MLVREKDQTLKPLLFAQYSFYYSQCLIVFCKYFKQNFNLVANTQWIFSVHTVLISFLPHFLDHLFNYVNLK